MLEKNLPTHPKPTITPPEAVEAWLAEHGNGMDRLAKSKPIKLTGEQKKVVHLYALGNGRKKQNPKR